MYMSIRLIIAGVFLLCAVMVIKKSRVCSKRTLYIVFSLLSVLLLVVSAFLPVENLFVSFESPSAAYEYYRPGRSKLELVVEGDACDFIVERKDDKDSYLIVPKTAEGWKIGLGSDTRRAAHDTSDGFVIYVYQYKNTNDYFITILDTKGGEESISDEYNTEFYSLERSAPALGKSYVSYYAHISGSELPNSLTLNGVCVTLDIGDAGFVEMEAVRGVYDR